MNGSLFPGFTVIFSIHLKVLECIFLGGFVFFVFFVFIFVDGLANRGYNRGRNHLHYYKPGFVMHQLVLEISLSSSLILPTLSKVPPSLLFRSCLFVTCQRHNGQIKKYVFVWVSNPRSLVCLEMVLENFKWTKN